MGTSGRDPEVVINITQGAGTGITQFNNSAISSSTVLTTGRDITITNDEAGSGHGRDITGLVNILSGFTSNSERIIIQGIAQRNSPATEADPVTWTVFVTNIQQNLVNDNLTDLPNIWLQVGGVQGGQGDNELAAEIDAVTVDNVTTVSPDRNNSALRLNSGVAVTTDNLPNRSNSVVRLSECIDWILYTSTPTVASETVTVGSLTGITRITYTGNRRLGGTSAPPWYQFVGIEDNGTSLVANSAVSLFTTDAAPTAGDADNINI